MKTKTNQVQGNSSLKSGNYQTQPISPASPAANACLELDSNGELQLTPEASRNAGQRIEASKEHLKMDDEICQAGALIQLLASRLLEVLNETHMEKDGREANGIQYLAEAGQQKLSDACDRVRVEHRRVVEALHPWPPQPNAVQPAVDSVSTAGHGTLENEWFRIGLSPLEVRMLKKIQACIWKEPERSTRAATIRLLLLASLAHYSTLAAVMFADARYCDNEGVDSFEEFFDRIIESRLEGSDAALAAIVKAERAARVARKST
jgi:hypothetical protein